MTQEVRREHYSFSDELEFDENSSGRDNNTVHSIFAEEGNQVDAATEQVLVQRVAHLCNSLEDVTKHVELRDDLMEHIWRRK